MDDPLTDDPEKLTADVYEQLLPLIEMPYGLFGHCMGALLSFLVARRIADQKGILPTHLFVSGCKSPSQLNEVAATEMSEEEVRTALLDLGTSEALLQNQDFFEMIQPIVRADFRVVGNYAYEAGLPLDVPITVILEKSQPLSPEDVHSWQRETVYPLSVVRLDRGIKEVSSELTDFFKSKI